MPLLEDDDLRAAVERDFPAVGRESFLHALRRVDEPAASGIIAAGRQLEAAAPLSEYPTVAVAGMLNSGKTSLVATFLSTDNRRRTLRGEGDAEGTHRFVLWLPARWRADADVWSLLMQRMGEALGEVPEMLSEDPRQAHRQYNNTGGDANSLAVPLIATDSGLDSLGIGLLDCPDVVTDKVFGRGSPEVRRDLLRRAATLCSAFVVVTGADGLRDSTLGDLLRISTELMPGVPRLLAINKVRPRMTPENIWASAQELVKHHRIDSVYAAYDFDVPAAAPFIPRETIDSPIERHMAVEAATDMLPIFYRLEKEADANPPAPIKSERLLSALPGQLDRAELFEQVRLGLENRLCDMVWRKGVDKLTLASGDAHQQAIRFRNDILQASLEFFAVREPGGKIAELRLHQSERIVRQLAQAFADAAPWYARFGMRLNSRLRRIIGGASDLVAKFTPSRMAEAAADSARQNLKRGKQGSMLTAARLKDALILRFDPENLPESLDADELIHRGERAIDRFDSEDFTSLDPRRLQEAIQEVWRRMPVGKKVKAGLTPLTIVFAAFGAALMVPIDFGGSGVILAASIKELFIATGVSLLATAWGGGKTIVDVEQQAAQQQLSNFLAVLCDVLGIPRANGHSPLVIEVARQTIRLPDATIKQGSLPEKCLVQWRVRNEFIAELQQYLPRT